MKGLDASGFPQKGEIYTLVQSGTQNVLNNSSKALVLGDGIGINEVDKLNKRAKRKLITNKMVFSLVDIAKSKGDFDRVKQYWNSFHCQNNIISSGNTLYGKFCKNRCCTLCTAIRKAEIINKYYATISQWEDVHFVTLTVKACKAEGLNKRVWRMKKAFNLIHNRCKKQNQRDKGIKLIGVKSLECNFNPKDKTYNPHYHIIVPSLEIAQLLKKEWIRQWKPVNGGYVYKYVYPKAQDIRKVEDLEHTLIETIKYGSKIFTEPDLQKKGKLSTNRMLYIAALDNIFAALNGVRLFDRFGFNLPQQTKNESNFKWVGNFEKWKYSTNDADWINKNTGECLTGYVQPIELAHLLNECINTTNY